jgi:hypothetical protein
MIPKRGDVVRHPSGLLWAIVGDTKSGKLVVNLSQSNEISDHALEMGQLVKIGRVSLPGPEVGLPRIGSKAWQWKEEDIGNDEVLHSLETLHGIYEIKVKGGRAIVTFEDIDYNEQEVAEFDLFRFGVYTEGRGTNLSQPQLRKGLRTVKRFCEMDARRMMSRKAAKPEESSG